MRLQSGAVGGISNMPRRNPAVLKRQLKVATERTGRQSPLHVTIGHKPLMRLYLHNMGIKSFRHQSKSKDGQKISLCPTATVSGAGRLLKAVSSVPCVREVFCRKWLLAFIVLSIFPVHSAWAFSGAAVPW